MMARVVAVFATAAFFLTVPGLISPSPAKTPDYATLLKSIVSVLPEWPAHVSRAQEPEGTGVVIHDGTVIVTALHVIDQAVSVRIRTSAGDIMSAKVHASDRATDLALLKIDTVLAALEFGGDARLGEPVCAIGNTFGLGLSISCGTVSAVHRAGVRFNAIEDFVQTDAAVNPGASGGALVDAEGALVGILSAIFTNTDKLDASIGVNFAVAAPLADKVARELMAHGAVAWNFGGAGLAQYPRRGNVGEMAAEVKQVRAGGEAEMAGVKRGDRVVEAAGRRIRSPADFKSVMARHNPSDEVTLVVRRGDETLELILKLTPSNQGQ